MKQAYFHQLDSTFTIHFWFWGLDTDVWCVIFMNFFRWFRAMIAFSFCLIRFFKRRNLRPFLVKLPSFVRKLPLIGYKVTVFKNQLVLIQYRLYCIIQFKYWIEIQNKGYYSYASDSDFGRMDTVKSELVRVSLVLLP